MDAAMDVASEDEVKEVSHVTLFDSLGRDADSNALSL
jgi:hypothetical protein